MALDPKKIHKEMSDHFNKLDNTPYKHPKTGNHGQDDELKEILVNHSPLSKVRDTGNEFEVTQWDAVTGHVTYGKG